MNSVKYNNWKDAVRAHAPGGFDANAAWEHFPQRNQPSRKKRKWLLWLAAACIGGTVLLLNVISIKTQNTIENTMVQRAAVADLANTIAVQQPFTNQTGKVVQPQKNNAHDINWQQPVIRTVINAVQKEKTKLPIEENAVLPAPETPVNIVQLIPENNGTPVTVKVEPVKEQPKKNALKVVHINELGNTPAQYAQQNMPQPETRTTPKLPLIKPSYANYEPEENEPPKVKRSGGLLRSVASLKEN